MRFLIVINFSYLEGFATYLDYSFCDFFYDSTNGDFSSVDREDKPFEFHVTGSAEIKYMDYSELMINYLIWMK
jgi:hypothetical protein